ncbi:hypothetical protein Ahia01_001002500, partial [Argonauta hians]
MLMLLLLYSWAVTLDLTSAAVSPFDLPEDIGTIWQVTDFHLDTAYDTQGDPTHMCHKAQQQQQQQQAGERPPKEILGTYGDYRCDSPWALVSSAVSAMWSIEPSPDFILWTGDSIPHVPDSQNTLQHNYEVIGKLTLLLRSTFPNTTIYPTVGNHDPYPANEMPFKGPGNLYYSQLLTVSHWDQLLQGADQREQFVKAGYYTTVISPGFRLISLNTNLYYSLNTLTANSTDPGAQLRWLRHQLEQARLNNEKVLLMAHVPPGIFERSASLQWMYSHFNDQLVHLLTQYAGVITACIFGHEHTDTFRLLYDDAHQPVSVLLMAPAVTPMTSTLPGVGANNPGIRLYHYNRTDHRLLNYHQYYLDLAATTTHRADWQLEYRAVEDLLPPLPPPPASSSPSPATSSSPSPTSSSPSSSSSTSSSSSSPSSSPSSSSSSSASSSSSSPTTETTAYFPDHHHRHHTSSRSGLDPSAFDLLLLSFLNATGQPPPSSPLAQPRRRRSSDISHSRSDSSHSRSDNSHSRSDSSHSRSDNSHSRSDSSHSRSDSSSSQSDNSHSRSDNSHSRSDSSSSHSSDNSHSRSGVSPSRHSLSISSSPSSLHHHHHHHQHDHQHHHHHRRLLSHRRRSLPPSHPGLYQPLTPTPATTTTTTAAATT